MSSYAHDSTAIGSVGSLAYKRASIDAHSKHRANQTYKSKSQLSCIFISSTIFREYILNLDNFPTDIINPYIQNFDFILGFASEQGNGQFAPNWNSYALNAQSVKELKKSYPNVRVVISIGGEGSVFNPLPNTNWVANAVRSIEEIINQYRIDGIDGIDGIDIHYDVINNDQFATVIGDVIQQLRNNRAIKVVSIAPKQNVQDHYRTLYSNNSNNIDLVDYRFYNNDHRISSVREFIDAYYKVAAAYSAGKVLAGIRIPHDPRIFGGIIYLIQNNLMPGVFVWNADGSRQYQPQNA